MPVRRVLQPFQEFVRLEAASGVLLMAAAILALAWANSPWAERYVALWQTELAVELGGRGLAKPLLLWVNDGLMAVFFLVVGLEIKRELLVGELADARRAALPVAAAVGGMVVPAALYLAINLGTPAARGWGVPVATDIAFALGVLALLGRRAPVSLKVFLTALAIVDDVGAVLVIALFYTAELSWPDLGLGALVLAGLFAANRLGVRRVAVYGLLGVVLWVAFLRSGVHATVAGVLLAMAIPARAATAGRDAGEEAPRASGRREDGDSPMHAMEHALHPWVTYAILPLFALANAGVAMGGNGGAPSPLHPVGVGILAGLVVGKPLGIALGAWLAVRGRVGALPESLRWRHLVGAACLGGIGFTMSIFVAGLAFADMLLLDTAKMAIFAASIGSGLIGWAVLRGATDVPAGPVGSGGSARSSADSRAA
jgi:NhaA family Na+:H+ antiporter